MSVKVANNRFIVSSLRAGFYQQIAGNVSSLQQVGRNLITVAKAAQSYRKIDTVEEAGLILSHLPIPEYQTIGQYYLGWCAFRNGSRSPKIFEEVFEKSQTYKAKALWSLAALEASRGNYEAELKYFIDSGKYVQDISTRIELAKGIATVKAKEGYNTRAVKDFENLLPLIRYGDPHLYYDCLNSLAVELCEVGRLEEARNISNIVLASPYSFAYPEWRETREDIERKGYSSRSAVFVALTSPQNVVPLPLGDSERTYARNPFQPPATVQRIDEWKKMPKKKNGDKKDDYELPANPTERDIFFRIMHIASQEGLSEKTLWKMLDAVEKIAKESGE